MQMINHINYHIVVHPNHQPKSQQVEEFIIHSCIHSHVHFTILTRYGYRGTDARRNLWVLPSGELLYYVAAVAVLLDREEDSQRHYTGHTEDIMW